MDKAKALCELALLNALDALLVLLLRCTQVLKGRITEYEATMPDGKTYKGQLFILADTYVVVATATEKEKDTLQ